MLKGREDANGMRLMVSFPTCLGGFAGSPERHLDENWSGKLEDHNTAQQCQAESGCESGKRRAGLQRQQKRHTGHRHQSNTERAPLAEAQATLLGQREHGGYLGNGANANEQPYQQEALAQSREVCGEAVGDEHQDDQHGPSRTEMGWESSRALSVVACDQACCKQYENRAQFESRSHDRGKRDHPEKDEGKRFLVMAEIMMNALESRAEQPGEQGRSSDKVDRLQDGVDDVLACRPVHGCYRQLVQDDRVDAV